jgi:hypothetical protein
MQMLCLKITDTPRAKRWGWYLAAALLSQAQLGFAADLVATDTATALKWRLLAETVWTW